MKKWLICGLLAIFLTGCTSEPTMETISDTLEEPVMAKPREISVRLPGEASIPAIESDAGRVYTCGDYDLAIQILAGGDVGATVESLSGFPMEALTVLETEQDGAKRYDFVWASAADQGEQLGRAVILDDGSYHYTMTVLRDADTTESLQVVWSDVFGSFSLRTD